MKLLVACALAIAVAAFLVTPALATTITPFGGWSAKSTRSTATAAPIATAKGTAAATPGGMVVSNNAGAITCWMTATGTVTEAGGAAGTGTRRTGVSTGAVTGAETGSTISSLQFSECAGPAVCTVVVTNSFSTANTIAVTDTTTGGGTATTESATDTAVTVSETPTESTLNTRDGTLVIHDVFHVTLTCPFGMLHCEYTSPANASGDLFDSSDPAKVRFTNVVMTTAAGDNAMCTNGRLNGTASVRIGIVTQPTIAA
jgi:hypothetical protein